MAPGMTSEGWIANPWTQELNRACSELSKAKQENLNTSWLCSGARGSRRRHRPLQPDLEGKNGKTCSINLFYKLVLRVSSSLRINLLFSLGLADAQEGESVSVTQSISPSLG